MSKASHRCAAVLGMLFGLLSWAGPSLRAEGQSDVDRAIGVIRKDVRSLNSTKLSALHFWKDLTDPKPRWQPGKHEPEGPSMQATLFRDGKKRIRKCYTKGGSEDTAFHIEEYFGADGGILFAYIQQGGVERGSQETRVYYRKGRVIRRLVKGRMEGAPRMDLHPNAAAVAKEFGLGGAGR